MKLQNLLLFKWNGYVSVASQGGYKKRPNEK